MKKQLMATFMYPDKWEHIYTCVIFLIQYVSTE